MCQLAFDFDFDFDGHAAPVAPTEPSAPTEDAAQSRAAKGRISYLSGLAAEDQVAVFYDRLGYCEIARRWRGRHGEIDLVFKGSGQIVFVEVKRSRTHRRAAERLTRAQMKRIWSTGCEYLAGEPSGQRTDARIDVALVDGYGRLDIVENAIWNDT